MNDTMMHVTSAIAEVIQRGGTLEEQIAETKALASAERWPRNVYMELVNYAHAVARRAPEVAQLLLVLIVEAVQVTNDANLVGTVAINAANILGALRFTEGALVYQKLAADAFEQSNDLPMHAAALANIGNELLQNVGDYEEALRYYTEALPHFPSELRAQLLAGMGMALKKLNRFEEAIERFEQATALKQGQDFSAQIADCLRSIGKTDDAIRIHSATQTMEALLGLANSHLHARHWEDALRAYERLLEEAKSRGSVQNQAAALHGIGNCYAELKQFAKAEEAFREGYDLAMSGRETRLAAFCLDGLGQTFLHRDLRERARETLRKAIALAQETHDRNTEARLWGNLGIASMATDKSSMREAVEATQRGIAIAESLGDSHSAAHLKMQLGSMKQAARYVGMLEGDPYPQDDHGRFDEEREESIRAAIATAERRGDPGALQQALSHAGVFYEVEKVQFDRAADHYAKAIDLHETFITGVHDFEAQRIAGGLHTDDYAGMVHSCLRLGDVERAWWYVERGRARSLLRAIVNSASEKLEQIPEKIASVRNEPVRSLQRFIPDRVAIVEYCLIPEFLTRPEMTFAFVITRDRMTCVDLQVGGTQLEQLIRAFRSALLPAQMRSAQEGQHGTQESWERLSEELHRILIEPVQPLLDGMESLWLVPSGPLHYLPFAVLRDDRYLIERFALGFLPSVNSLRFLKAWTPGEKRELAAFVNPDCRNPALDLPGTVREAAAIRLNGRAPQCWQRADAGKDSVERACSTHDVVHLACHAHFDPQQPMLSFLQLAPTAGSSGRWELREILKSSIRASMIVLSACTTSYPDIASGEELLSLSYAFLHAGASTVVGTLWKVRDDVCPLLMEDFYRNLTERHAAQAMQQAQLKILRSPDYSHPSFWGAFQPIGIVHAVHSASR